MDLLQIVPALPPALSGVGDYALMLARELLAAHGVRTRFVSGDPGWRGNEAAVAPFLAEAVCAREAVCLGSVLDAAGANDGVPMLLHYVGYGYATRGCPFWLVNALEQWKTRTRGRLLVLFHELYADGEPIWTSAFWTSPVQRWLATRLGRLADARRMTTTVAARQLRHILGQRESARAEPEVIPVFSTLGEPTTLPPFDARERTMIVFGSRNWRMDAYTKHAAALAAACRRLEIERVSDIGSPLEIPASLPFRVEKMGPLPADEACALFARSRAGFFTYPVPYLGKSTIFAAYCAAGLVPVTHSANRGPCEDGLRAGEHYLFAQDDDTHWRNPGAAATNASAWYGEHRLAVHVRGIAERIMDNG